MGFVLIGVFAVTPLWESYELNQNPKCGIILLCNFQPFRYDRIDGNENLGSIIGKVRVSSRGVFAVNEKVDYEIDLEISNFRTDKEYHFIFVDEQEDISRFTKLGNEKFINYLILKNSVKVGSGTNGHFHAEDSFITSGVPTNYVLAGFILDKQEAITIITETNVLFSTVSQDLKIQDTANRESRIDNKAILGLTWMGIGLFPILLGADFLVRIRLEHG